MTETKKAWERLKKQLTKDGDKYGLKGCMYMTAKQEQNRTATISLVFVAQEYDEEIARTERELAKVLAYTTWTEAEKQRSKEYAEKFLEKMRTKKAKYGTKRREAEETIAAIKETAAWQQFAETVGVYAGEYEINSDGAMLYRILYK